MNFSKSTINQQCKFLSGINLCILISICDFSLLKFKLKYSDKKRIHHLAFTLQKNNLYLPNHSKNS